MAAMKIGRALPAYLVDIQNEIEEYARDFGLDFFPILYEVLDYKTMNEVAAFGGFPTRYPHWRFGMDYEQLSKGYEFGLSKIYEMVINTNPAYAYLLEGNSIVDQKIVMAHVCGHVDFFKHNYYFSKTNRKMIDGMANHASLVRRHMNRHGIDAVEGFLDICLSVENLIDPMSQYIRRRAKEQSDDEDENPEVPRLRAKDYMESYINPPEFIKAQKKKLAEEQDRQQKFPTTPERDILLFLIENAPLERWQRDCLEIIRREAYYFAPQAMTKIMNEGWAVYWHSKILTTKALSTTEIIDYADANAGVLATAPGRLNPYKLGVELFRNICDRWDKGQFGADWDDCDVLAVKQNWDRRLGLGNNKIFEVRKLYNDLTFIDEFFTLDFCYDQKFYAFGFNDRSANWEIQSREFDKVKAQLLRSLTNRGQPRIYVEDGNYENRGELLLSHRHDQADLDLGQAQDTMQNLFRLWTRPVNLTTQVDGKERVLRIDSDGFTNNLAE